MERLLLSSTGFHTEIKIGYTVKAAYIEVHVYFIKRAVLPA